MRHDVTAEMGDGFVGIAPREQTDLHDVAAGFCHGTCRRDDGLRLGRQILAIGGNERAARLSGIPVARVKRLVYFLSGVCAGIAGLIFVAINSAADANLIGLGMELDAIAAVVVGGTLLTGGRATVVGTLLAWRRLVTVDHQLAAYRIVAAGRPAPR